MKFDVDIGDLIREDQSGLLSFDPGGFWPIFNLFQVDILDDEIRISLWGICLGELIVIESQVANSGFYEKSGKLNQERFRKFINFRFE